MRARKLATAFAAVPLILASAAGVAVADVVTNNLDNTIDNPWETMNLTVGGAAGTTGIRVVVNDPNKDIVGCNLTGGESLTVSVESSKPGVATVSPSRLTFTTCEVPQPLTVTPVSAGSSQISFSLESTTSSGVFDLLTARFNAEVSAPAPSDTTAPVITPNVTGTIGNDGWYTTDVGLSWSVVDTQSTISSRAGCDATSITTDQNATAYTCTATSAGGTSSQTVSIKRDATAPSVMAGDTAVAGWYNSDVSRAFTASDVTSGLANGADANFTLTASNESADASSPTTASKTVYDAAGNSTTRTLSAFIDRTNPQISGSDVNDTAWRSEPLSHSFTAGDALSGLENNADSAFTLTASDESPVGGTTTVSREVFDEAGNSETRTVSARIDLSGPEVLGEDVPAGEWRNTPLKVDFTASDNRSGLANDEDGSFSLTAELESPDATTPTTVSKTVSDKVGNSTTRTVAAFIDTTAPSGVGFSGGPAAGEKYYPNNLPSEPTCTAQDSLSGIASCVISGYSDALGTHTMTATATDEAGNSTVATRTYTVRKLTLTGFYAPVDLGGVFNSVKGGATVPLKFEVFDGTAELDADDLAKIKGFSVKGIACPSSSTAVDDIELLTTGGTSLRYDGTAGQFIQNWQTPKKPGACYEVAMTTEDDSSIKALFKLK